MEHDFVLKYQTSKISNIKTKISNNIQTLYLNKAINNDSFHLKFEKYNFGNFMNLPLDRCLEHITLLQREFSMGQWTNAFLIRCICNKKL